MSREKNRTMVYVFVLCALSIVLVTWTLAEKFIPDARVALFVNLCVAALIGILFENYLESRTNNSVDFLIGKLQRVSKGDLTQVFKEDPDDVLPYGLSFQLNEMMKYFRENVGNLWKTSSLLVKQLNMFLDAAREVLDEFRGEVQQLGTVRESLTAVRADIAQMLKRLSAVRVNTGSGMIVMEQLGESSESTVAETTTGRELLDTILRDIRGIDDTLGHVGDVVQNFTQLSQKSAAIEKSMINLTNEANLVKLNVAIDSSQQQTNEQNYRKLAEEARTIAEQIAAISQESGSAFGAIESRVRELVAAMEQGRTGLKKGLDSVSKSAGLLESVKERCVGASTGYGTVLEHVRGLNGLLGQMDTTATNLAETARRAEGVFDKFHSDSRITLLKFDQLGGKIEAIEDNVRQLEEFNRLFEIG